ncbi:heme-binding protein [Hahella ganghwensis]|uniref:heme-binding protein n=1 Tax=Hahella ganghwensis TaxID=286420 RepID=UPI000527629A|nr:heme-binding protein [Hahella ganghwensis]
MTTTAPNLTQPLIHEPDQSEPPAPTTALGPLEFLVGTWTNQNLANDNQGGPASPYSYCLMPLPQEESYILKNFSYYEEITFSAIHGTAPNRGGYGTQVANTLFYEQRIYFADGPAKDQLVHAENGSWLYLTDAKQLLGPYGNGEKPGLGDQTVPNSQAPSQKYDIIKQMSVPHGNSILSAGSYANKTGSPVIEPPPLILPTGVNTDQYKVKNVGNLNPEFTENPNLPLATAIQKNPASSYIQFDVDSNDGGHPVTNIGFEQQHAKVSRYFARYWLESFGSSDYTQLQYSQTIVMDIPVNGTVISFPHVTTNTLTKKN